MYRRSAAASIGVATALMLLLGSCSSPGPDRSPSGSGATPAASSTPSPSPTVANLDSNGELALGTYTATAFRPRFRFTIAESGWYAGRPTSWFQPLNVYPEHPERYLIFYRLKEVYKPQARQPTAVPRPRDLVAWFREHPGFSTTTATETTLGGLEFLRFEADVVNPRSMCAVDLDEAPCVLVAPNPGDAPLHYLEGVHVRIYISRARGRPLFISIEAPKDEFDSFAPSAEDVLQSTEFLDPLKG